MNRFAKQAFENISFLKAAVAMRFPAKKRAGCPKARRDFPPRKDGIPLPPSGCLGTPPPSPPPPRVYTGGARTLTSQPKFLESIGYQICLTMVLRYYTNYSNYS